LLAKLADGSFTATQVVTAFSKRAAIAQQLVRPSIQDTRYSVMCLLR
jgi:hypothetical protein